MRRLKILIMLLTACGLISAADFKAGGLYYNILSPTEVEVAKVNMKDFVLEFEGETLLIPASVEHEGLTYQVVSIEDEAFTDANWSLYDWSQGHAIDEQAKIKAVIVSEGLKKIGRLAFAKNVELASAYLPNSLEAIGYGAFAGCVGLKSINTTGGVEVLEEQVFDCCNMTSIDFLKDVRIIGEQAFWGNASLTAITIPESVESIKAGAFASCSRLRSIYIPQNVRDIGNWAFAEANRSSGYIGEEVYGAPLTVVIDNNEELLILPGSFGIDRTYDSQQYNLRASMTLFFLGSKPPVNGGYKIGMNCDYEGALPALIFVPKGLREAYLEPIYKIPQGGDKTLEYKAFSDFPYVCEFDPSIIAEGNCLLSIRKANNGGMVIVNGKEISDVQALGIQTGTTLTIQFIPDEGYILKQIYWNHNLLDVVKDISGGISLTMELNDNARLDCFFEKSDETGIKTAANEDQHPSDIYNLDGRCLDAKPQKGIYIQNGKKYISK